MGRKIPMEICSFVLFDTVCMYCMPAMVGQQTHMRISSSTTSKPKDTENHDKLSNNEQQQAVSIKNSDIIADNEEEETMLVSLRHNAYKVYYVL